MFTVGNTPLVKVDSIYAKLECVNPCGSVKDRIAKYIIDESERQGKLREGMKIVEATSGNTGISFSYYAKLRGYEVVIVMPENMTEERKNIIRHLGAELVLCSKEGSFVEAARIRDSLALQEGYFNPDQFSNALNVECHYKTIGQEIISQMSDLGEKVDAFVAGVGTGGTLIGVGTALKEKYPNIKIFTVEPFESAVMSGEDSGEHIISGIGDGFIPDIVLDNDENLKSMINGIIKIKSEDTKNASEYLRREYMRCVGISSGANYLAAKILSNKFDNIVTIFPDSFSRYKSWGLKHCSGVCPFEINRTDVLTGRVGKCS